MCSSNFFFDLNFTGQKGQANVPGLEFDMELLHSSSTHGKPSIPSEHEHACVDNGNLEDLCSQGLGEGSLQKTFGDLGGGGGEGIKKVAKMQM